MEERLEFIRLQPKSWVCWNPIRAGLNGLALLQKRYPQAIGYLSADRKGEGEWVQSNASAPWWKPSAWFQSKLKTAPLKPHSMDAGFAEPVMDMEKITLTYVNPEKLVEDLRRLGRNFHVSRFEGLRGKNWYKNFQNALLSLAQIDSEGRLALTFEVVYGHALKPQARVKITSKSEIDLDDMRQMLQNPQKKHDQV